MGSIENSDILPNLPYFVSTLGYAEIYNSLHPRKDVVEDTITALIDSRAKTHPEDAILGEFLPPKENQPGGNWEALCLSMLHSILSLSVSC